jgi:hypothetical protein
MGWARCAAVEGGRERERGVGRGREGGREREREACGGRGRQGGKEGGVRWLRILAT